MADFTDEIAIRPRMVTGKGTTYCATLMIDAEMVKNPDLTEEQVKRALIKDITDQLYGELRENLIDVVSKYQAELEMYTEVSAEVDLQAKLRKFDKIIGVVK